MYSLQVLLAPPDQISEAASLLYNIVPLLVVLSPLPHLLYLFSHYVQTFQGEHPFPLRGTEVPFAVPRSPSAQHPHTEKAHMRPTHGQWVKDLHSKLHG